MMTIRELSSVLDISYEAARSLVSRQKGSLEGHISKVGGKLYLDDEAVDMLIKLRKEPASVRAAAARAASASSPKSKRKSTKSVSNKRSKKRKRSIQENNINDDTSAMDFTVDDSDAKATDVTVNAAETSDGLDTVKSAAAAGTDAAAAGGADITVGVDAADEADKTGVVDKNADDLKYDEILRQHVQLSDIKEEISKISSLSDKLAKFENFPDEFAKSEDIKSKLAEIEDTLERMIESMPYKPGHMSFSEDSGSDTDMIDVIMQKLDSLSESLDENQKLLSEMIEMFESLAAENDAQKRQLDARISAGREIALRDSRKSKIFAVLVGALGAVAVSKLGKDLIVKFRDRFLR